MERREQKLILEDMALLKLAEKSFDFWNNTKDAEYDSIK